MRGPFPKPYGFGKGKEEKETHMPDFLSYDPLTGVSRFFDYDEQTGMAFVHTSQDIEPWLAQTKELANSGATDKGIKKDFWYYASLPPVVQLEMRKKGIDIFSKDPAMIRRMDAEIEKNYPNCKTTGKRVG